MFIGRRPDGTIYGAWTSKQLEDADHPGVEKVEDTHPELVAFQNRKLKAQPKTLVDQMLALPPEELQKLKAALGM